LNLGLRIAEFGIRKNGMLVQFENLAGDWKGFSSAIPQFAIGN